MTLSFALTGKTALITGGGQGMGAAIARSFAKAGAQVLIASRTGSSARAVAEPLGAAWLETDIGSRAACDSAVREAVRRFGGLDIVVHNAAHIAHAALADIADETLEKTLAVNLKACFWLAAAAVPHMKPRGGGRILVTSSVTGPRAAFPGLSHYAASKGGVDAFVRSAALELAPAGITVNAVAPGFIAKPGRGSLSKPETRAAIERYIPLGAMGSEDDIAAAMLYLASEAGRYVTGQIITVDGGATLPETGYAMERLSR